MYRQGSTVKQLAARFEVHVHTVSKHLKARGIPRRGGRPSFTDADLPHLIAQYQAGDSCATIANRYSVDPATVMRWLRRAGVKMRPRRGGRHSPRSSHPGWRLFELGDLRDEVACRVALVLVNTSFERSHGPSGAMATDGGSEALDLTYWYDV